MCEWVHEWAVALSGRHAWASQRNNTRNRINRSIVTASLWGQRQTQTNPNTRAVFAFDFGVACARGQFVGTLRKFNKTCVVARALY